MKVLCLDLEGVLIPEIWLGVAEKTGVDALKLTTRDIADYDELMRHRLGALDEHGIKLADVQSVIATLAPLPGAREFLDWARERFQVAIISDTFYEFALPLMAALGYPMLLCHRLRIEDDRIADYLLRQPEPKKRSVEAFQSLGYEVLAAGDSYNDIPMLEAAEAGFLYRAPERVRADYPEFPHAADYQALQHLLGS